MAIKNAAQLLIDTVNELSNRSPAIIAAAARQLGDIILSLHFGDNSFAELRSQHSRLIARVHRSDNPDVEAYIDNRSLNLLFDLEKPPVSQVLSESLDVRGERAQVLAVWRTFQLLAQRASGLRAVQTLWREYRDQFSSIWGEPARPHTSFRFSEKLSRPSNTGWSALDFLARRYPSDDDVSGGMVSGTVRPDTRLVWDGRVSTPWWTFSNTPDADLMEIMQNCKARVAEELQRLIPVREPKEQLYNLMREYPVREGKGLRPTLTIATCSAFGGQTIEAIRTAVAIELFHNAFLIHDDIADESTHRRGGLTMHDEHSLGLAVNTGDAMNLLAIDTVLSNLQSLGLARTLGLINEVIHMCRESVEGQAIELGWIHDGLVPPNNKDYFLMSTKKTGWYTCISPCRMGAVCAGETDPTILDRFNEVFRLIGIAFQIQDDLLNLIGETDLYGKEPFGDLLEGKRTIMLIHLFRTADKKTRKRLYELIRIPRMQKTQADAEEILAAMHRFNSLEYAISLANRLAHQGVRRFEEDLAFLPETEAKGVLRQIANYVTTRLL